MVNVTVIGGGQIGEALIAGLVKDGGAHITVTNRRQERRDYMAQTYGVATSGDNREAVADADVVFVCVKPYAVTEVVSEFASALPASAIVVSMAAGVRVESLQKAAGDNPVVRVMPNTPMLVGRGMCLVVPGPQLADAALERVQDLLNLVGESVVIEEGQIDAATALSGSAPAYLFLVAEALVDAGVQLGVPRDVATQLVNQTVAGSGQMLVETGQEPGRLRANVTSPGGTTAAAIRELEESGLRGAFYRAAEACAQRSAELG
ncbi:pyrroline-5-carboxylate reductase [Corynebacterium lizhenjunii]|uniref:Pyrroline-5-carboxylate reductase n=1 Tax=Corynebacterium lizhenjunii TaxID=2709394 RepID=A0A7T0KFI4_9CORY|nr:pyrroline-5-carboxylate reductase [Corynebacterium lizhenjunii]QPK79406.1 pyrroline-5-carboxylate reductase [Corynebacterium lizhenjunii]